MNKKYRHFIYLLLMLSLSIIGLSYVGVGVKNYSGSDEFARLIEPSRIYESYGYKTIDEWKTSYKNENLTRIVIGVGLIGLVAGVAVFNVRRKNK